MSTVIIQDDKTKDGSSAESPPSSDAAAVPAQAIDMATAFGVMSAKFDQSQTKQAELEAELRAERERREMIERRLDTTSGQVDQVMTAISKAAEAEAAAAQSQADATSVVPPKEEPPKGEESPARPRWGERMGNWINGR